MPDRDAILGQHQPHPQSDSFPVVTEAQKKHFAEYGITEEELMARANAPKEDCVWLCVVDNCGKWFANTRGLGAHKRYKHQVLGPSRTATARRDKKNPKSLDKSKARGILVMVDHDTPEIETFENEGGSL